MVDDDLCKVYCFPLLLDRAFAMILAKYSARVARQNTRFGFLDTTGGRARGLPPAYSCGPCRRTGQSFRACPRAGRRVAAAFFKVKGPPQAHAHVGKDGIIFLPVSWKDTPVCGYHAPRDGQELRRHTALLYSTRPWHSAYTQPAGTRDFAVHMPLAQRSSIFCGHTQLCAAHPLSRRGTHPP